MEPATRLPQATAGASSKCCRRLHDQFGRGEQHMREGIGNMQFTCYHVPPNNSSALKAIKVANTHTGNKHDCLDKTRSSGGPYPG